ncbi:MAG: hypothetical protein ABIF11_00735 [Nitrospirota bacterium]
MAETLFSIDVNKRLIWDYTWKKDEYQSPSFFKWYLSRVLNNRTYTDIKQIPLSIIRKYFNELNLSRKVEDFWKWYLKTIGE